MAIPELIPYKKAVNQSFERTAMLIRKCLIPKRTLAIGLAAILMAPFAHADSLTIAAAASLQDALKDMTAELEKEVGASINITAGASGTLQQQIAQGAPIDVFLSAADKPIAELEKLKLLTPGSSKAFLSNDLILIAGPQSKIKSVNDLKSKEIKRIALGEPRSVPAGDYAMQALTTLKLEQELSSKFLFAKDVRQVLAYVERGEVEAGFVYKSDLESAAGKKVLMIQELPGDSHKAIQYTMTIVAASKNQDKAKRVLSFLESSKAAHIWTRFGFKSLGVRSASVTDDKAVLRAP